MSVPIPARAPIASGGRLGFERAGASGGRLAPAATRAPTTTTTSPLRCRSSSSSSARLDDREGDSRTALWRDWWFEARNADELAVLAGMPGADVDAATASRVDPRAARAWVPGGVTAVILAAQRDDPASIALLASLGADLDARDENGAAAVHHAAFEDAADAIAALTRAGADLNAQDARDGSTPAILAAFGSRRAALRALIAVAEDEGPSRLDLTLRDVGNATVAGHCAQRRLREELLDVLRLCGPGGAGRLRRGQKTYLAERKALERQLETLDEKRLGTLAKSWGARTTTEEGDDKKTLIRALLATTP